MRLHLTLYVAGARTARALAAKQRLGRLVEQLDADVRVEVVDVLEDPTRAEADRVIATPTLVRAFPQPGLRVIGDLVDPRLVAESLGVASLWADSRACVAEGGR